MFQIFLRKLKETVFFCLAYPKSLGPEFSKNNYFHLCIFGMEIHDRKTSLLTGFWFFEGRCQINEICFVKEVVRDGNSSKSFKQQG